MDFSTVYRSFNEADAMMVQSRLEAAGFEAHIVNDIAAATTAAPITTGGVWVQVSADRAEEALQFLAAPPAES
jgi:hypothetical protein